MSEAEFNFEERRQQERRWLILRVLQAGHPIGASEYVIASCLSSTRYACGREELRAELKTLETLNLVRLDAEQGAAQGAKLRARGLRVIERLEPPPDGVLRMREPIEAE